MEYDRIEHGGVESPQPPSRVRPAFSLVAVVILGVAAFLLFRSPGTEPVGASDPTLAQGIEPPTVSTTGDAAGLDSTSTSDATSSVSAPGGAAQLTVVPAEGPVFGEAIPWTLIFDDGIDGVLAVDPNGRRGSRSVIQGQRAGDPPHRLQLVSRHLVVGWSEVFAVSLPDLSSVSLGSATIAIPAAEPDRIWLVDYPGGAISLDQGPPTVSEVLVPSGVAVRGPVALDISGFPAVGLRGGLAIETDTGIQLWDADSNSVTQTLGGGASFVMDVSPDIATRLAWCPEWPCRDLHITFVESGDELVISRDDATEPFMDRAARFSNDRRFLAAPAGSEVVIVDLHTMESWVGFSLPNPEMVRWSVAWAPSGPDLFVSSHSYGLDTTTVVHHRALTGETQTAVLPFGGTLALVVVDQADASAFLNDESLAPADCPAPRVQPSGRSGICGFRF